MTVGPWRPICLRTYQIAINDFRASAAVSPTLDKSLDVELNLTGVTEHVSVLFSLSDTAGHVIRKETQAWKSTLGTSLRLHWHLDSKDVALWWPVGYGDQPLYTLEVVLLDPVSVSGHTHDPR